jgi:hypothetical protein
MSLELKSPDPAHDVDALLADVQLLVRAHQALQSENTQLKMIIAEQNQRFVQAQNRLIALTEQLPSLTLEPLSPPFEPTAVGYDEPMHHAL